MRRLVEVYAKEAFAMLKWKVDYEIVEQFWQDMEEKHGFDFTLLVTRRLNELIQKNSSLQKE